MKRKNNVSSMNVKVFFGTDVLFPNGTVQMTLPDGDNESNEVIMDFVAVDTDDIRFEGSGIERLPSSAIDEAREVIRENFMQKDDHVQVVVNAWRGELFRVSLKSNKSPGANAPGDFEINKKQLTISKIMIQYS